MDNAPGEGGAPPKLSPQAAGVLSEAISLVFGRWTALQMAVENQWGGRDSRRKAEDLAVDVLSWFSDSKGPLYIDDLENMLEENMVLCFNTEIDDGSAGEVAEQLMVMHEDCAKGNLESIEDLRRSHPAVKSVSQSVRVFDANEDESSDEEVSDMAVDEPKSTEMAVEKTSTKQMPDEDGWYAVTSRRNKEKFLGRHVYSDVTTNDLSKTY